MDDIEWEEIDESAIEECMVLATQMCSQAQPQENGLSTASRLKNGPTTSATKHSHINKAGRESDAINRKYLRKPSWNTGSLTNGPGDSGYVSGTKDILKSDRSNGPDSFMKQRFSDLYVPNSNSTGNVTKSSVRGRPSQSQSKAYEPLTINKPISVASDQNASHMPNTSQSHQKLFKKDNQEQERLLKKSKEEQAALNEKIQTMQGEISLLRTEMNRKDAALENERLDRFTALQAAEKRGRDKADKLVLEAQTKSKENAMLVDKLQAELHFKKMEAEELLNRCRKLEQQKDQTGLSRKRARSEIGSPSHSSSSAWAKMPTRFDFVSGPSRVPVAVSNAEVQTESYQPQTSGKKRRRLPVAVSKGRGSGMRRTALLLSTDPATTKNTPDGTDCHLPKEWSHIISQTLVESSDGSEGTGPWSHLVEAASERLQYIHSTIISDEAEKCDGITGDAVEWYEKSIAGALRVLDIGRGVCKPDQVLPLLISHLSPHCIKDEILNKRIRHEILQATEKLARKLSPPINEHLCDKLVSTVRLLCECIESSEEATEVLRLMKTLGQSSKFTSQLCSSGSCIVGAMCKQMRDVGDGNLEMIMILIALVKNVMKHLPPWLSGSCICPTRLLNTVITRSHQELSSYSEKGSCGLKTLVVALVRVLHTWSVVDPSWWERVSALHHYPVLMCLIPSAVPTSILDKHTVDQLSELYEFDEGHLAAD